LAFSKKIAILRIIGAVVVVVVVVVVEDNVSLLLKMLSLFLLRWLIT